MPDFEWLDVTGIVTMSTVIAVAVTSVVVAHFLWLTSRRVDGWGLFRGWVVGIAFLACMAAGRMVEGSAHWEAWIGTMALWSEMLMGAWLAVLLHRRVIHLHRRGRASD